MADFRQAGTDCHCFGRLYDEVSLSLVYNAADVFTAPSIQDNLPNTVMEAMACGVPCVTFNVGGMADMIDHEANGYLARPFEVDDYVRGLKYLLDEGRGRALSRAAREQAVRRFDLNAQADKYHRMYLDALAHYRPPGPKTLLRGHGRFPASADAAANPAALSPAT
ncbi:MAG: glycosyltransferase [Sedimentisphaerales bacterium]|nr:glycosyltransferase [Sedimentisphaerales bacterium]